MSKFDPYSSTYDLGCSKHPNFLWTGQNALISNPQGEGFQGNIFFFLSNEMISRGIMLIKGLPYLNWLLVNLI